MNGKQRMLCALSGGRPDVVPIAPCYLNLYIERAFVGHYYNEWKRLLPSDGVRAITLVDEVAARLAAVERAYWMFQERFDWMPIRTNGSRAWAAQTVLERKDGRYFLVNTRTGARAELIPPSNACSRDTWDKSETVTSEADVDRLVPLGRAEDWLASGVYDVAAAMVRKYGDTMFMEGSLGAPFWGTYHPLGFQGLMLTMVERPKLFERLLERRLAYSIEVAKCYAELGVHGVWIEECFASADLISAEQYERFAFHYEKRQVEAIRKLGLKVIFYFCGDAMPRLSKLVQLGADALAFEESKKAFKIEIGDVRRQLGDRSPLFGNIDADGVLCKGSDERLEAEVRRQLDAGGRHGAFVISLGSPITLDTPAPRVDSLARAARVFGRYKV